MVNEYSTLAVVIPAAGIGKRMKANCPKQYLKLNDKTILEHTVERLLSHPNVGLVVLALGEGDEYFSQLSLSKQANVTTVIGGAERVNSVLAGLQVIDQKKYPWVMVHDAARPCVTHDDITALISSCFDYGYGGLLASPVRDTMKEANHQQGVKQTIDRDKLWHALTPQMYETKQLINSIEKGLRDNFVITDESSAIEQAGFKSQLIEGRSDNLKITRQDDLALASFILAQQAKIKDKQQEIL